MKIKKNWFGFEIETTPDELNRLIACMPLDSNFIFKWLIKLFKTQ